MLSTNLLYDNLFDREEGVFKIDSNNQISYLNSNLGWFTSTASKWIKNLQNSSSRVTQGNSSGLIQIITNNYLTKGSQNFGLNVSNFATNNILRMQVYGINGKFQLSYNNTNEPISMEQNNIEFVTILDTGNIAENNFDQQNLNWNVNLGEGYEYIATRFITDGVEINESMEIDNVFLTNNVSTLSNKTTLDHPSYEFGTNLHTIAYWSKEHPFIDVFKTARTWVTQAKGIFNTNENNLLNLDENGWVKSLPKSVDNVKYNSVYTSMFIDENSAGNYVVLYEGEGKIQYSSDTKLISCDPITGKDLINITPSKKFGMSIIETDPNNNGNYLRNIRIVPEAFVNTYEQNIFNPNFLNHIDDFQTLRFMDWMETNNSTESTWEDRPLVNDYTYFNSGSVPVETMVNLANINDSNPWFTLPHMATDEYVRQFAQYVKNNLEPERKIYVEYSNEVWNWNFKQTSWVNQQALKENMKLRDWYSKRTTQITQIWDDVFGNDKERVIGVMGAQAANIGTGNRSLSYAWADNPLSHEEYGIDSIAIAPYFGNYIGNRTNKDILLSWTQEVDGGLNKLFDEITQGGLLPNSPTGGALELAYKNMTKYMSIAQEQNLELVAYEGGQHLVDQSQTPAIIDLFAKANRDPRMGDIYKEYLQTWFNIGGSEFVNFSDISDYTKYGYWGLTEGLNQSSPKYDAVMNLMNGNVA